MSPSPETDVHWDEGIGPLLRPDRLSAWSWVLAYTAILSSVSVLRYHLWIANGFDLGLFEQGLWLTLHHGLAVRGTYTGSSVLGFGGSWLSIPLALIYGAGGVGLLLVVQAFSLGIGYLLLIRLGEKLGVDRRLAHPLGLAYLLFPTILGTNLFDFHPETLAVPLFFWIILTSLEGDWWKFGVAAILAIAASDLAPILLFGTGIALVRRRPRTIGLTVCLGAVVVGGLDWLGLIPAVLHGAVPDWTTYYGALGATPAQGLATLKQNPWILVDWIRSPRPWEYIVILVSVPLFLLGWTRSSFKSPWWIPALLLVEANLVSPIPIRTSPFSEFSIEGVPFIFMAVLDGMGHGRAPDGRRGMPRLLIVPLIVFLFFLWQQHRTFWRAIPSNATALQTAVSKVPADAPVLAQNFVIAHLSDRPKVWLPSYAESSNLPRGTFILLDPSASTGTTPAVLLKALSRDLRVDGQAYVVYSQDGITLARLLKPLAPVGKL